MAEQQQQQQSPPADQQPQQQHYQQEEEELPAPSIFGCCVACIICLLVTPCLILCCCCSGANTAAQKVQGKRWDDKQGVWIIDNIEQEKETIKNIPADDSDIIGSLVGTNEDDDDDDDESEKPASSAAAAKDVKETEYYDTLGVSPDADESKIKRAYYVKARKWHPDRNDSTEANEKFQKIGEAYQVLSVPKLRKVYDKQGAEGLSGDRTEVALDQVDPSLVFTFLFGSDAFNDIIGRLQVVTQTMAATTDDEEGTGSKLTRQQMMELERRRVIRLAVKLVERIDKYVNCRYDDDSGKEAAKAEWKAEAARLVEVRYGEEILHTVGTMYRLVATQCIGSWGEGMDAKLSEHGMKMEATINAMKAGQAMQQQDEDGQDEDQLPGFLQIMWNSTVIDISTTIREVVMKVLCDKSVANNDVRKKTAEAVKELGIVFEKELSKQTKDDSRQRSARGLYQSAAQAAMEKTLQKMQEEEGKAI